MYRILKQNLVKQKDFAYISRILLKYEMKIKTCISIRNPVFIQALKKLAREQGYNYIVYKYGSRHGERDGKFFFFKDLSHDLAKALLERSKVKIIEV